MIIHYFLVAISICFRLISSRIVTLFHISKRLEARCSVHCEWVCGGLFAVIGEIREKQDAEHVAQNHCVFPNPGGMYDCKSLSLRKRNQQYSYKRFIKAEIKLCHTASQLE